MISLQKEHRNHQNRKRKSNERVAGDGASPAVLTIESNHAGDCCHHLNIIKQTRRTSIESLIPSFLSIHNTPNKTKHINTTPKTPENKINKEQK